MKTNVQPGMLARVVAQKDRAPATPEIIGRIVYVERPEKVGEIYKDINGRWFQATGCDKVVWIVSAKEPMPLVRFLDGNSELLYMYERPMLDVCLRPLLDPNLDVSDEEVKKLFSVKEVECQT
jgi:hypothetical protein